jgi:hypothetical protein
VEAPVFDVLDQEGYPSYRGDGDEVSKFQLHITQDLLNHGNAAAIDTELMRRGTSPLKGGFSLKRTLLV